MNAGTEIPKAVIQAWAWRTSMGDDGQVIERLLKGEHGFQTSAHFDNSLYDCPLVAAIKNKPAASKHQRYLRRMGLFALEVTKEVAQKVNLAEQNAERVGLFFGYGGLRAHWDDLMPAFVKQTPESTECWQRGLHLLHPFWMLQHLSNNAHAIAAQELGVCGDSATYSGANAGAQAIAAAIRALNLGLIDTAIVTAYDSLLEPETLVELRQRHALNCLSEDRLTPPYAPNAQGYVPSEATTALVLQRFDKVSDVRETFSIQALTCGDGNSTEAGINTLEQITRKLLQPGDIIDGAGIAQAAYDAAEITMLESVLASMGQNFSQTPLTCIASLFGQTGAAHCLLQVIVLMECLKRGQLPAIHKLQTIRSNSIRPVTGNVFFQTTAQAALALSTSTPGLAGGLRIESIKI